MYSKKEVLLLVSGWHHDFGNDKLFLRKLRKKYEVLTFSYPGYKSERLDDKAMRLKGLANHLNSFIKANIKGGFTFLGFSMGTQVILKYKQLYNTNQKAILIAPSFEPFSQNVNKIILFFIRFKWIVKLIAIYKPFLIKLLNLALATAEGLSADNKARLNLYTEAELTKYHITLKGAFYTLVALLTDFVSPLNYLDTIKIVYGVNDKLKEAAQANGVHFFEIEKAGHYFFNSEYKVDRFLEVLDTLIYPRPKAK
ncbi:MAG: hypothetical protein Fur003_5970 [Candidatus Dojkabacteria bacterium]